MLRKLFLCGTALASSLPLCANTRPAAADERVLAYRIRTDATYPQTLGQPYHDLSLDTNSDETNVADYAGSFSKLLEHNGTTGILTAAGQAAYEQLLLAMQTGLQSDFNAISFAAGTQRVFVNPQAGLAFSLIGQDSSLFSMPEPPTISSAQGAADMIETYLQAICRDVLFEDYGTGANSDDDGNSGSITNNAALVLDDLGSAFTGPRNGSDQVDASVLFRGSSDGDKVGPYQSQFLLHSLSPLFPAGCAGFVAGLIGVPNLPQAIVKDKQLYLIAQKREFGVSWNDFVDIQNGLIPKQYASTDYDSNDRRYIICGRDAGGYVHHDGPFEPYYKAINILASNGFPISSVFPYANGSITKESAGFQMGPPDAFCFVASACLEAFKAAWAQKWRAYRKLRPEAMAGLIHRKKTTNTNPYNLHSSLFSLHNGIDFLALVLEYNQRQSLAEVDPQELLSFSDASTYLLSQMYPEGSPAHPSYPSGHATGAGACVTIIKAIFNDTTKINTKLTPSKPNPADPTELVALSGEGENDMTVGGELDKLASNIAIARNFSGVHWRSDAEQGILLGEAVAITCLQAHARTYNESGFTGYELTKRDGTRIRITADSVEVIS